MITHSRSVVLWLVIVCVFILAIVAVGGITRLTGSGLSMVDWKPIMGVVPPMSEAAWQARFEQYQAFPEFQKRRSNMTRTEFKSIFLWEYVHRLLARGVGIVFLVPYLYFLVRRRLSGRLAGRLAFAFVLGGLQGLMGWYMVKSGLVDNPYVSHYRLAAHLSLALALYVYLLWIILDLVAATRVSARGLKRGAYGILALLCVQIVYGAFVAGLDAGYGYNTFPMMLGRWIPPGLFVLEPWWSNLVRYGMTVQFIHRLLAWLLAAAVFGYWLWTRKRPLPRGPRSAVAALVWLTVVQFLAGVFTLILLVPVSVAVLHQVLACFLLGAGVWVAYSFSPRAS
jgi:cytochrome c oxidase assembly protein subunit 15